jgi:hypothetical protein
MLIAAAAAAAAAAGHNKRQIPRDFWRQAVALQAFIRLSWHTHTYPAVHCFQHRHPLTDDCSSASNFPSQGKKQPWFKAAAAALCAIAGCHNTAVMITGFSVIDCPCQQSWHLHDDASLMTC